MAGKTGLFNGATVIYKALIGVDLKSSWSRKIIFTIHAVNLHLN
jgi:hypothetical protein